MKFALLEPLNVTLGLDTFGFIALVIATVCIAAGGNVINDIHDIKIDRVNKPNKVIVGKSVSEKTANYLYIGLTFTGVCAGFYVVNAIGRPSFAIIFIIIAALLNLYAVKLKEKLLLGNVLVSFLVASALLVFIIFDILPGLNEAERPIQLLATHTIILYAGFAFYINLMREIVKDIQDINGDQIGGKNTLAVALGRTRSRNIVFAMGIMALIAILGFTYFYLYQFQKVAFYFVFFIGGPLLVFCIKAFSAEKEKEFKTLSILLKLIMLTGVCSLFFYTEIL
ncbi:4-hydroxybenzoate-octaprenyltransferase [unidentified eubacterium SCB49]|nr:4-hydroxybenzoate-octaprenyltransferase [unidentified eubacterium SCB49]